METAQCMSLQNLALRTSSGSLRQDPVVSARATQPILKPEHVTSHLAGLSVLVTSEKRLGNKVIFFGFAARKSGETNIPDSESTRLMRCMIMNNQSSNCKKWYVFSCISTILSFGIAKGDELTKQRFMKEYPLAASSYKRLIDHSKAEFRFVFKEGNDKMHGVFYRSGKNEKVEIRTEIFHENGIRVFDEVYCTGPDSYYHLVKKEPEKEPGSEFTVRRAKGSIMDLELYDKLMGRYIRSPLGGFERPILAIMQEPGFVLVDANPVPERPGIVHVLFHSKRPARIGSDSFSEVYDVEFDTSNHWAVVAETCKEEVPKPLIVHRMKIEYGPTGSNGFALPKRIEYDNATGACEVQSWVQSDIDPSEFETSFYGLPRIEVKRTAVGRGRGFWAVFASIFLLVMIGIMLHLFPKRHSRNIPPVQADS